MIERKQGWILGLAKFYKQEDVKEKLQEAQEEAERGRVTSGSEATMLFPEFDEVIPEWRKIRIERGMVRDYQEEIEECPEYKEVLVTMRYGDQFVFKCTIEEFDKVFFE